MMTQGLLPAGAGHDDDMIVVMSENCERFTNDS